MNSFRAVDLPNIILPHISTIPALHKPVIASVPLVDTQDPMYQHMLDHLQENIVNLNAKTGQVWQAEVCELYRYTNLPAGTHGPWYYIEMRFRRNTDPWVRWRQDINAAGYGDLVTYYESQLEWYYQRYIALRDLEAAQGRAVDPVLGYYQERREELAADILPVWAVRKRKGAR